MPSFPPSLQLADEVASKQAELAECRAAVEAAEQREKEVSAQWRELEADAEKRGRERGKRVKELEGRVKAAKQEAAAAVKALKVLKAAVYTVDDEGTDGTASMEQCRPTVVLKRRYRS